MLTRISGKAFSSYWADHRGTIIAAFAIMLPVVVSSVGMSMDMAQGYLVRQRLAGALDAAALAAASSETDEDAIRERVEDFFEQNYPEEKIGAAYNLEVEVDDDDVIVSAYADYDTSFMRLIGIDTMTVYRRTVIRREVQGLEVALVLDNTGSMADGDKIGALKEAATNFVNILFDATDDPERIKIGLVPYANSVRVGRYGLGLNPDGTPYEVDGVQAEPFVTLPAGISYTNSTSSSTGWYGCVVEHNVSVDDIDQDEADVTMVAGSYGQLWKNTTASCGDTNCNAHGWNPAVTDNDAYPQNVLDDYEGPWDIYMYGTISRTCNTYKCKTYWPNTAPHWGSCRTYYTSGASNCQIWNPYTFNKNSTPSTGCPRAAVQPMISDQDTLLGDIDNLREGGNTRGDAGIIWGYRMLSPDPPFTEGHDWDNKEWRKAIVIMTDGINTRDGTYSYDWVASKNQLDVDDFNDRFLEVCDALKENNVLVYTIILGTGGVYPEPDDTTKQIYEECATSPAQYYDAPSNEELVAVFERISRELANLHISE